MMYILSKKLISSPYQQGMNHMIQSRHHTPLFTFAFCVSLIMSLSLFTSLSHATPKEGDLVEVIIESVIVQNVDAKGKAWDEDQSAPDLFVEVKSGKKKIIVTPVQANTYKAKWGQMAAYPFSSKGLKVYIYDHDENKKPQRVSALLVKPTPADIKSGMLKKYKGKGIKELALKFRSTSAQVVPQSPKKQPLKTAINAGTPPVNDGKSPSWIDESGTYTPQPNRGVIKLRSSMELSSLTLTPKGTALYQKYIKLQKDGFIIEAKEVLLKIISRYPKSVYALKARRILF